MVDTGAELPEVGMRYRRVPGLEGADVFAIRAAAPHVAAFQVHFYPYPLTDRVFPPAGMLIFASPDQTRGFQPGDRTHARLVRLIHHENKLHIRYFRPDFPPAHRTIQNQTKGQDLGIRAKVKELMEITGRSTADSPDWLRLWNWRSAQFRPHCTLCLHSQ